MLVDLVKTHISIGVGYTMDYIKRYTTTDGVRLSVAVTTNTVDEARKRHDLWPVATAALGRTMTGALLMASDFKNKENISIRLDGKGPLGVVHVDAFADNTVRGYVDHPHIEVPLQGKGKLDVGYAVGTDGEVKVTRFTKLKQNYSSSSPLHSGEIADDLAYYLYVSEQIPSTINLGVLLDADGHTIAAGGFLVQALPDANDEVLAVIEDHINQIGSISAFLKEYPDGDGLVEKILAPMDFHEVYHHDVSFQCTCNKERFEKVLLSLSKEDKMALLEDATTELVCHYCNETYHFSQNELKELFKLNG